MKRLFANPKAEVVWNVVTEEVLGDPQGLMKGIRVRDVVTDEVRTIDATGCFVFIGFRPNTGIIDGHFDHDEMGYVKTDTTMATDVRPSSNTAAFAMRSSSTPSLPRR